VRAFLDAVPDSPHTRRAYGRHLRDAFAFLQVDTLSEVTGAMLAGYRADVTSRPGIGPSYQAQILTALRSFLGWSRALGAHHISGDVVRIALRSPRATVVRPHPRIAEAEITTLLEMAATPRDRAMLAVLLGGGLRAAELCHLDVRDLIDGADGLVRYVRQGKGKKDRHVPVTPDVRADVFRYLEATGRRLDSPGPLFIAHDRGAPRRNGGSLTTRAVGYMLARLCQRAGLAAKGIRPHSTRHAFADRIARNGGQLDALRRLLGHANLTTTQRYLANQDVDELRRHLVPLPRT